MAFCRVNFTFSSITVKRYAYEFLSQCTDSNVIQHQWDWTSPTTPYFLFFLKVNANNMVDLRACVVGMTPSPLSRVLKCCVMVDVGKIYVFGYLCFVKCKIAKVAAVWKLSLEFGLLAIRNRTVWTCDVKSGMAIDRRHKEQVIFLVSQQLQILWRWKTLRLGTAVYRMFAYGRCSSHRQ